MQQSASYDYIPQYGKLLTPITSELKHRFALMQNPGSDEVCSIWKSGTFLFVFCILFILFEAPTLDALTLADGDISSQFMVKTHEEKANGKTTILNRDAYRLRLRLTGKTGSGNWKLGISTVNRTDPTATLVFLGRDSDHVLNVDDFLINEL